MHILYIFMYYIYTLYIYIYDSQIVHHNPCFKLFILRHNLFGLVVDGEGWWFEHSMS